MTIDETNEPQKVKSNWQDKVKQKAPCVFGMCSLIGQTLRDGMTRPQKQSPLRIRLRCFLMITIIIFSVWVTVQFFKAMSARVTFDQELHEVTGIERDIIQTLRNRRAVCEVSRKGSGECVLRFVVVNTTETP